MTGVTYTMFIESATGPVDDEVVARGVSLPRALVLALGYGDKGKPALVYSDVGALRCFAIGRRPADGGPFQCATCTVLQRSEHPGLDSDRAFEVFEQVLLQHPHEFWEGRVMTDEVFAQRHRKEEIAK